MSGKENINTEAIKISLPLGLKEKAREYKMNISRAATNGIIRALYEDHNYVFGWQDL